PAEKRLAVHVEDHPLDYASFEGTIPAGEYGAGDVLLWDRGEWTPVGDAAEGYRRGKLKFLLAGEKLPGGREPAARGGRAGGGARSCAAAGRWRAWGAGRARAARTGCC